MSGCQGRSSWQGGMLSRPRDRRKECATMAIKTLNAGRHFLLLLLSAFATMGCGAEKKEVPARPVPVKLKAFEELPPGGFIVYLGKKGDDKLTFSVILVSGIKPGVFNVSIPANEARVSAFDSQKEMIVWLAYGGGNDLDKGRIGFGKVWETPDKVVIEVVQARGPAKDTTGRSGKRQA